MGILWMICSFTRLIKGKLINNKNAETIIEAMRDAWIFDAGLPSIGFWADNGGEFENMKMDELTSKLGISVKFGPAYSPWSNGLNERNHASADITIKKMLEDKKVKLNDSLVKAAAWTHNTNVNKLGYSPLTLATGKAVSIPGLTMGNVPTESMTDAEAVKKTM